MRVFCSEIRFLKLVLVLAFICVNGGYVAAQTDNQEFAALKALTNDWGNLPESWTSGDPCGSWEGITCKSSHIITITLSSVGVTGQLTGDLLSLSELQILDLSYNKGMNGPLPSNIEKLSKLTSLILLGCDFSGTIPDLGSLQQLVYLSLNSNKFTGKIPASIGNLKKLYWLDLSDNKLSGSIPVSDGTTPGLNLLVNTKHFHFGMNQLSGKIPPSLFSSDMTMIHALFDNNKFSGSIPPTLGLVDTLLAVRFDRNKLSGAVPSSLKNLTHLNELVLSNNLLSGLIPDLTGMSSLNYVDMSNNTFAATDVPVWLTTLQSLTTVMLENTKLEGQLPADFFSISQLQTVIMRNNRLDGTLDLSTSSGALQLIDLQSNSIETLSISSGYNFTLMLVDNPLCQNSGVKLSYCNSGQDLSSTYSTPAFCVEKKCPSGQTSSPICKCGYPYTGTLIFRAPSFSAFGNEIYFTNLQLSLLESLVNFKLPVDSISLSNVAVDDFGYLNMRLAIFPSGQVSFNKTGLLSLGFIFSNQTYKPDMKYGTYVFIADAYTDGIKKASHTGLIIGAAVGGSVLLLLLLCVGGYAFYQKKRAKKAKQQANPFVYWDKQQTGGGAPQLKGARFFSFEELQKCTDNFSEENNIGAGGYGKVYKGIVAGNQIVAIKRSQQGSMQGSKEFKNEIELLSRVHHKNLVKLIGFCYEQGEHMLVYEFIPNGTLTECLSGKSGIQLDWIKRLMITLGAARGLQYLHELADPPIIHRDIKSSNILLDESLNAKVADFGLSKLFGDDADKGYVTTQVKGTMGYLDPEYFMTNQLSEKSDVFSFGVVMLEMITARAPIQKGKYVVKEIQTSMDRTKDLYNLDEIMDPVLLVTTTLLVGLEKFVDLALQCVEEAGVDRPTMGEVVKEIESIVKFAGLNPNLDSANTSWTYEGASYVGFTSGDDSLFFSK